MESVHLTMDQKSFFGQDDRNVILSRKVFFPHQIRIKEDCHKNAVIDKVKFNFKFNILDTY